MTNLDNVPLFLGFDSSTQGLKATIINPWCKVVARACVNYDEDLPEYGTDGGVHIEGNKVYSNPLMWAEALDLLLQKMKDDGAPLSNVILVSGSGQQHGSVWWNEQGTVNLSRLNHSEVGGSLREILEGAFATEKSPVWMDSRATAQCRDIEVAVGGALRLAEITGSTAYERFTGPIIAWMAQQTDGEYAGVYDKTVRISLVSSYMASLLVGDFAPIDLSDGSGMNLLDIRDERWDSLCLKATAPGLKEKLGSPVRSNEVLGNIARYFRNKYDFSEDCEVVAWSGDNPNSLAGLCLVESGDCAVSLGTSDTMFALSSEAHPGLEGHIFRSPVGKGFMNMICYKGGSFQREAVRDAVAGGEWWRFERFLSRTPVGNNGAIAFHVPDEGEITPRITRSGVHRFLVTEDVITPADSFIPSVDARAVLEAHFVSMRIHGEKVGLKPKRIIVTGGASANLGIVRVIADVFGVPVFALDGTDSASLGAAYRALHAHKCVNANKDVCFSKTFECEETSPLKQVAEPDMGSHLIYTSMVGVVKEVEKTLTT